MNKIIKRLAKSEDELKFLIKVLLENATFSKIVISAYNSRSFELCAGFNINPEQLNEYVNDSNQDGIGYIFQKYSEIQDAVEYIFKKYPDIEKKLYDSAKDSLINYIKNDEDNFMSWMINECLRNIVEEMDEDEEFNLDELENKYGDDYKNFPQEFQDKIIKPITDNYIEFITNHTSPYFSTYCSNQVYIQDNIIYIALFDEGEGMPEIDMTEFKNVMKEVVNFNTDEDRGKVLDFPNKQSNKQKRLLKR